MSGTLSSLNTALSALRYNQVAMDVASGNIANSATPGYARRSVVGQTTGAPAVPAIWSRWDGAGSGVQAGPVTRMVDPLLDARARTEHARSSFLDARATSLARDETAIGEPGDGGVAAALTAFQQAWHDVSNNPGDSSARTQLLSRAESLRSAIAAQATSVSTEWSDQRTRLDSQAAEVTAVAGQLADLNRGLRTAYVGQTDAGNLLDQRDQLTLRLAELTGAQVTIKEDSTADVTLNGQSLVSGYTAATVAGTGSADLAGAASNPVGITVNGVPVSVTAGELGGTVSLLRGDLPDYAARLDSFVSEMVTSVNTQHAAGVDLAGATGGTFFTGTGALTLQVALTDPRKVAAAAAGVGGLDNTNATALATMDLGASSYRNLVTSFGVSVASTNTASTSQATLTSQVDASREAVAGVNVDEEMVALMAAQRGYEGAARVLTTMDSVLDTLINRTGLVH
ncbi:MAG: flagellar hook-associated protein FlgK [Nocardioidaceae bacterium]|nr:flagellar hook-associated protein FlgK [Nocardioidaceae bacterium]